MPRIYVGPAAERELADSGSEGTLCVVLAVTAAIAVYQADPQCTTALWTPGRATSTRARTVPPLLPIPPTYNTGTSRARALLRHVCTFVLGCDCLGSWPSVPHVSAWLARGASVPLSVL